MALIACPECQKEISDTAATCPHCGAPKAKPNGGRGHWVLWTIATVVAVLGFMAWYGNTPEVQAKSRAREAIALCRSHASNAAYSAGARGIASGACSTLEDNFRRKYNVDP
jgi:hypothetical protein